MKNQESLQQLKSWLQRCNHLLPNKYKLSHNKPGSKYTKIFVAEFTPNNPIHIPNTRFIWAFVENQSGNILPPASSYKPHPNSIIANIRDAQLHYVQPFTLTKKFTK